MAEVRPGLACLLAVLGCSIAWAQSDRFVELGLGANKIHAEVADSEQRREAGLMRRSIMPEDTGMLFVFEKPGRYCFWMKNTRIPLTIAFVDSAGKIAKLTDMQPGTEHIHCPDNQVRYALEMNQGWFRKRGIKEGATLVGLPR